MAIQFVTGKVRFAFVNIFTPRMNEMSGKEEYTLTLLIDKRDKETLKKFNDAAEKAAEEYWGKKRPGTISNTLKDGDSPEIDEKYADMYNGNYFVRLSSKTQPGIVDQRLNPILDSSELRSGDYGRVSLAAYAYGRGSAQKKSSFDPGITYFLNNVQLLEKGEPLGGGKSRAEDDFDIVDEETADNFLG